MKKIVYFTGLIFVVFLCSLGGCKTPNSTAAVSNEDLNISEQEKLAFNEKTQDTVTISSDKVEYEIIIFEPGFNTWLQSIARPPGYYSQSFLETRNNILVIQYNQRVAQPFRFDPNLYIQEIDYDVTIDYGYDVNYKLYNYFIFFQRRFNQRLGPFVPRI